MADTISVIIGAQIEGLLAGVAEAKEAIEGLRAPVDAFVAGLGGISEAVGAAFAVGKIQEFVESMGELGEQVVNTAAVIGTAPSEIQKLNVELALMGGRGENATKTMEMFAQRVGTALSDPAGRTAQAFERLGYSQGQLAQAARGQLIPLLLDVIARTSEFAGSVAKLEAERAVLGRGMDNLGPMFRLNAEGLHNLAQEAEATGAAFSDYMLLAMEETGHHINTLSQSIVGLSGQAFMALRSSVDGVVGSLTRLVQMMTDNIREGGALKTILQGIGAEFRGLAMIAEAAAATITAAFEVVGGVIQSLERDVIALGKALAGLGSMWPGFLGGKGLGFGEAMAPAVEEWNKGGEALKKSGEEAASALKKTFDGWLDDVAKATAGELVQPAKTPGEAGAQMGLPHPRGAKGKDTTKADYEAFAEEMRLEIAEADKDWAQISAIYDKWAAHAKEVFGDQSKEYRQVLLEMTRAHQQHIQQVFAQEEQNYAALRSIDDQYMKTFENNMKAMADTHKISKQQEYGFDIQYAAQLHEQQRKILEDMIQDDQLTVQDKTKIYQQLLELDARYVEQVSKFNEKLAADSIIDWNKIVDSIKGSMEQGVMAVIKGTQTIGQAFRNLGETILNDFLKLGIDKLFDALLGGASGGGGLMSLLSGLPLIGGLFGGGAGLSAIFGSATPVAEGAFAFLERGGIVPSAAGGWMVPSFQGGGILARLHSNEMVLPSHISQAVQNMAAGGGGSTINIHAIDTQSGGQFLMRNAGSVGQAALRYSNVSPRAVSSGGARFP